MAMLIGSLFHSICLYCLPRTSV